MTEHGTAIGWTHAEGYKGETWNPSTGCSRVSDGCDSCYAEELSLRRGWSSLPWLPENAAENVILHPERLNRPYRWREPRAIFTNSMSDLFHPQVPYDFIRQVWTAMHDNPRHRFMTLTKRPKRLRDWTRTFAERAGISEDEVWPEWMWVGTSIENREQVDRADLLREVPAAVRFISAEPLLGPLICKGGFFARGQDGYYHQDWPDGYIGDALSLDGIAWLIAGGESGSKFRPMEIEWMADLHEACRDAGTAFFAKQDSGRRPGQRGRIPDDLWVHDYPQRSPAGAESLF